MANEQYLDSDGLNQFWKSAKKEIMHEVDSALGKVCTISISANDDELGVVSGGGSASIGTEIVLSADPKTDADFVGWKENGEIVSVDNRYRFTVEKDRVLVGEFTKRIPGLGSKWYIRDIGVESTWSDSLFIGDAFLLFATDYNTGIYSLSKYNSTLTKIGSYSTSSYVGQSCYGNGVCLMTMAVGTSYQYGPFQYSTDGGVTWSSSRITSINTSIKLYFQRYSFLNGEFIATGYDENNNNISVVYKSTDAKTWSKASTLTILNTTGSSADTLILYGHDKYVAIQTRKGTHPNFAYSFDLINWHLSPTQFTNFSSLIRAGLFDGEKFIVYTHRNTNDYPIYYSYDGIEWKEQSNIYEITKVVHAPGRYTATWSGMNYTNKFTLQSYDGINWFKSDNLLSTPLSPRFLTYGKINDIDQIIMGGNAYTTSTSASRTTKIAYSIKS